MLILISNDGYSIESNNTNNINMNYENNNEFILEMLKKFILSYNISYDDDSISNNSEMFKEVTGYNVSELSQIIERKYKKLYNKCISQDYNISELRDKLVNYRILAIVYEIINDNYSTNYNDFSNV